MNKYQSSSKTVPRALLACLTLCTLLLTGCAMLTGGSSDVGFYLVNVEKTPMYRYGPAQNFGADFNLTKGQRVVMLRREYGYSRVMTDEGQSGYVATEDLVPAPPQPKSAATGVRGGGRLPDFASLPSRGRNSGGSSSANSQAVLQGVPLFGADDLPPLPESTDKPHTDAAKPEFRFPKPKPGFRVSVPDVGASHATETKE